MHCVYLNASLSNMTHRVSFQIYYQYLGVSTRFFISKQIYVYQLEIFWDQWSHIEK